MKMLLSATALLGGVASGTIPTVLGPVIPIRSTATSAMPAGFGRAVAISGDWAFVGEPNFPGPAAGGEGPQSTALSGVVRVYRKGPTGWKKSVDIPSPSGLPADGFGATLATDGTTLLVGQLKIAPSGGGGRGGGGGGRGAAQAAPDTTSGMVYVYRRAADGKWTSEGKLPLTGKPGAMIGTALAVSGSLALVGAPNTGDSAQGSVSVLRRGTDGSWKAEGALPAEGLGSNDHYGTAIALSADRVAVGAPGYGNSGAVFVYARGKSGEFTPELTPLVSRRVPDGSQLGSAVTLKGDRIVAGAPSATFAPAPAAAPGAPPAGRGGAGGGGGARGGGALAPPVFGMVVVFEMGAYTGRWTDATVLTPYDFSITAARFGTSVASVGDEIWVGAPGSETTGRIYRVKQDKSGAWSGMSKLGLDSLDGTPQFGATMAVSGDAGIVGLPNDGAGGGSIAFLGKGVNGWGITNVIIPPIADAFAAVGGKEIRCAEGKASAFDCSNTGLVSFMPLSALGAKRGVKLSSLWGWTDPLTGKDYALVGRTDGLAFVDISDPVRPRYLGELMRTAGSNPSVWREIKTYKNHAYVVSDGSGDHHGIQIFDLTRLRKVPVGAPPQKFTEDGHYNAASIHDLTINETSGFGYAVGSAGGTNNCSGGSHIIDLKIPRNPKFVTCFADAGTGRSGRGYTHDIQCVMYHGPDKRYTDHEICIAANETHISIQDVTDKANIKVLSHVTYPDVSYAHQGWFSEDQAYWFEDDELDEGGFPGTNGANGNGPNCPCGKAAQGTRTLIWDMKDLTDPVLAKEFIGTTHATDHNQFVKGNRLYQSNYRAGLRILDITDPVNPREVGYLDTYPYDNDRFGGGNWGNFPWFKNGLIGATSGTEGFFLIRDRTGIGVP